MPVRNRARPRGKRPSIVQLNTEPDGRARPSGSLTFVAKIFSRYRNVDGWTPNPVTATVLLIVVRVLGALHSPIADCDETFNYWEPLHYILHGWGLQTWEYAPRFALRSYAFLLPYAAIARTAAARSLDKVGTFYAVRVTQALLSAFAEAALYDATVWRFGTTRAYALLALLLGCPGIFRAASELLPSSFAMIALTAAWAHWLVGEFAAAVAFVALASLFGWIYVVVVAVPMAFHVMYRRGLFNFIRYAITAALPIVGIMLAVDSHYYGKYVLVPLQHVMYNVFPVQGAGPDIFGVEPWTYYVYNLVLNMPLAAPLVALLPLQALLHLAGSSVWGKPKDVLTRVIFLPGPLLMAALFFAVPHKEERFMAPLYPLLSLLAAVSLIDWVNLFSHVLPRRSRSAIVRFAVTALLVAGCIVGASRAGMQIVGFGGTMRIYNRLAREELNSLPADGPTLNLCVSKEWHRFPSHFFMPHRRIRVRFLKFGFDGLLPKYYGEQLLGTRVDPSGINMFNKEDPQQWFNVTHAEGCHYFVDLDLSHRQGVDKKERNPIPNGARHIVFKEPFLDSEQSPAGLRAFFIPRYSEKLVFGQYVLVRNLNLLPLQ